MYVDITFTLCKVKRRLSIDLQFKKNVFKRGLKPTRVKIIDNKNNKNNQSKKEIILIINMKNKILIE